MGKSLKEMKEIYFSLVDANGVFRVQPRGKIKELRISPERQDIFRKFITLLTKTDLISHEAQMYIKSRDASVANIYRRLLDEGYYDGYKTKPSERAIISKVQKDQYKIDKVVGAEIVTDLFSRAKQASKYNDAIDKAFTSLVNPKDKIELLINIDRAVVREDVDEDKFNDFLDIIYPFITTIAKRIEAELDSDVVGYFNYITTCPEQFLTEKQLADKQRIKDLIQ